MKDEDNKELFKSLKDAKDNKFKSALDDNAELKRELSIGQLRNLKFGYLGKIKRKGIQDEELDAELDKYNERRKKLIEDIKKEGFEYIEDEENDDRYKKYEM
ncbi:hypothetical protein SAMN02927916_1359 [Flavobacterium anhuiense]|uniref:Uncharacterized protein n=1 Tax=Flavobacterium anhuiense TaxID=459526 RepID=A0ABY0LHE3_9FLAO|nr:hypothetical protein [Flavobacterium anhuiense]SCY17478.1 hypothetical protein SAMN02927916_1359 [Flavobacterium anhuiense]